MASPTPEAAPYKKSQESEHFARIPRRVVRHRMETAESLEDRLFWAILLSSWCGPQTCEYAALKNDRGYLVEVVSTATSNGEKVVSTATPIPAKVTDLLGLLNLSVAAKGNASRAISRLEAKGAIRREKGRIYPLREPAATAVDPSEAPTFRQFHIADRIISTDNLGHLDPDAQTAAVQWLEQCSTEWKNDLNSLRYRWRELLVQGLSERGVIIDEKSRREEEYSSSSDPLQVEEETTTTAPPPEPEPQPIAPIPPEPEAIQNIPVEEPKPLPGTPRDPEIGTITGQLGIDLNAARRILRDVRAVRPDATALEIVRACFWKARQMNGKAANLVGMWIVYLPQMAESDQWLEIRAELRREGFS